MRWIVSLTVVLMACGGPQVPTHNGYKPKEAKPWKKAKALKWDDKMETKAEGDVSYPDMRRARWYEVTLPANGQLTLQLEVTPPGDAVNDDFDLGMEVFDPANRSISKSDLEESDAHELNKKKTLVDLIPGKYLIHLFLQGRMDTAEFVLRASFKTTAAAEMRSNFPVDVPFTPALAMVPITDDTPAGYRPPQAPKKGAVVVKHGPKPQPKEPPPPAVTLSARIIGIQVVSGGTQITLGRGTLHGAADGMKGKINGISGTFSISGCNERTCTAIVPATLDQIKGSNSQVTLTN